jgi:hypothetical protein
MSLTSFPPSFLHSIITNHHTPPAGPLTVVVGRPINIPKHELDAKGHLDQKKVDYYHQLMLDGFSEVYEKNKGRFGMKDIDLLIK